MWPLATCISSTRWTPRLPSLVFFLYTTIAYPHSHAPPPTPKFHDLSSWDWERQLSLSDRDTPRLTLWTYVRSKASRLNKKSLVLSLSISCWIQVLPCLLFLSIWTVLAHCKDSWTTEWLILNLLEPIGITSDAHRIPQGPTRPWHKTRLTYPDNLSIVATYKYQILTLKLLPNNMFTLVTHQTKDDLPAHIQGVAEFHHIGGIGTGYYLPQHLTTTNAL